MNQILLNSISEHETLGTDSKPDKTGIAPGCGSIAGFQF